MLVTADRPALRALVLAVLLVLVACGGTAQPASGPPPGADNTSPVFTISQSETTLAHECTARQTVHITGAVNVIQLVEPCRAVTVGGNTNQVVIQSTGTLVISGYNQHVTVQKVTSGEVRLSGSNNELVCGSRMVVADSGTGTLTSGCTTS